MLLPCIALAQNRVGANRNPKSDAAHCRPGIVHRENRVKSLVQTPDGSVWVGTVS